MNCHECIRLLAAEREGLLPSEARARLAAHVEQCASCRRLRADLEAGLAAWRTEVARSPAPDARRAWETLRLSERNAAAPVPRQPATLLRLGLPLAAAAALTALFMVPRWRTENPEAGNVANVARVEYLEAGSASASTLVFVDRESGWLVVWASDADPAPGI